MEAQHTPNATESLCNECGEPWPCPTDMLGDLRAEFLKVEGERNAMAAAIQAHFDANWEWGSPVKSWDALDQRLWATIGIDPGEFALLDDPDPLQRS